MNTESTAGRRSVLLLAVLVAVLAAVTAIWVSIDRRPPESDHANHLERALFCHRALAGGALHPLRSILEESSFYPPLVPCLAGVLYFVAPVVPLTAQTVMLAFLAVGVAAVFALGRRLDGPLEVHRVSLDPRREEPYLAGHWGWIRRARWAPPWHGPSQSSECVHAHAASAP